jgi:phosphatidylinositol alpha-1,6-mannosyltransferase
MSLKVLHVLDHSIPLHSGYSFRTLALLREQRKLGWSTFHLTSPKHTATGHREEEVDGWHFFRTPPASSGARLPGMGELALMRRLEGRIDEVVSQVKPDLLHVHSPVLNALPALRVGRRAGIPVVYEVRAFWEDAAVDLGTTTEGSVRYRLTRRMETHALKEAAHVFTICEGLRSDILARGIASAKVTIIPNAVDVAEFEPGGLPDLALKRSLGLGDSTVVGFIGSFYAYEGLDLLLTALPQLLQRRPDVRVLLVGGGPQDAALRAHALSLDVGGKVVFTGRVPHDQVKSYYDLIDVLAYPRHKKRITDLVTPLKPLEAMAQGRLMVASDVGGHRELMQHRETGWLFEAGNATSLADAMDELLSRVDLWPGLKAAARSHAELHRNWVRSAQGYVSVYERLVAV